MKGFIGIILFGAVFILFGWVYYLFLNVAIAIWFPAKAKKKWVDFLATPGAQLSYWLFKWVAPLWVILVTLTVALTAIKHILLLWMNHG